MRTGLIVEVCEVRVEAHGGKYQPVKHLLCLEVLMPHGQRFNFVVDNYGTCFDVQVGDYLRFGNHKTLYGAWRHPGKPITFEPLELVEGPVRSKV